MRVTTSTFPSSVLVTLFRLLLWDTIYQRSCCYTFSLPCFPMNFKPAVFTDIRDKSLHWFLPSSTVLLMDLVSVHRPVYLLYFLQSICNIVPLYHDATWLCGVTPWSRRNDISLQSTRGTTVSPTGLDFSGHFEIPKQVELIACVKNWWRSLEEWWDVFKTIAQLQSSYCFKH